MSTCRETAPGALLLLGLLAACGGGSGAPSAPGLAPRIGGHYTQSGGLWTIHLVRSSDGHEIVSRCDGALFLNQSPGASVAGQLTGSVTVGEPCWPISFDISGLVWPDGRIELTTNGPPGPGLACPPALGVQYAGRVGSGGAGLVLSAEGQGDLQCPNGEAYAASYTLNGVRTWRYDRVEEGAPGHFPGP